MIICVEAWLQLNLGLCTESEKYRCRCRYEPHGSFESFWSAQALAARPKRTHADEDKMVALVETMLADSVSRKVPRLSCDRVQFATRRITEAMVSWCNRSRARGCLCTISTVCCCSWLKFTLGTLSGRRLFVVVTRQPYSTLCTRDSS